MKRIFKLIICLFLAQSSLLMADEAWQIGTPATADIGKTASYKYEYLKLHVPKSFEGRTAEEWRNVFSADLLKTVRIQHRDSEVQLRGSVTKFDFDYTKDCLDVQVYRSKDTKPSASSCLDCHGGAFPRTTATIGYVREELEPEPYVVAASGATIYQWDTVSDSFRAEINHWVSSQLLLKGSVMLGTVEQKNYKLDGQAYSIGLAGTVWHKCMWSGNYILSKLDTYSTKQTITGNLTFRPVKRLKLSFGGAAFIDGYTQYGTDMSELSMMTLQLQKDNAGSLPNLFNRLKNDAFGTWIISAEYEVTF